MRYAAFSICLGVLGWGIQSAQAQSDAPAPKDQPAVTATASGTGTPGTATTGTATTGTATTGTATTDPAAGKSGQPSGPDAWRFKWHQGSWWYWLPAEKWVYWTGDKWTAYEPAAYRQYQASRPRRSYSYSQGQSGAWGPVRYDGYGNRQYPYSRRKSGIQQLGPVPAMGGVRAMPGWGGER